LELKEFVTGIQHFGIPTKDITKTAEFFQILGFEKAFETDLDGTKVIFHKLNNIIVETYEDNLATMKVGAIDHIAIDVVNIEETYKVIKSKNLKILDDKIQFLPFWEKGVKFFTIIGPDQEKIEFSQML